MFGILNCHERYAYVNGTIPQLQTAVADFLVAKTSGYFISTIVSLFETAYSPNISWAAPALRPCILQ
jgi:hypothetical protein